MPTLELRPSPTVPTHVMLDIIDSKAADGPIALHKLARYACSYINDVTILAGEGVEGGSHMDQVLQRILHALEADASCHGTFTNLARIYKSARKQHDDRMAARAEDLVPPKVEA